MKKYRLPLISLFFFLVASAFIAQYPKFLSSLPSRQVELSHGVEYGAVLKDFLFVQEVTLEKRYLSRIDVYMAKLPSQYNNSNVFVLIDDQHRILFTKRFSSADFGEALHFPFEFGKAFDIGSGKTVYACIYSTDGDQQSYIGLARKEKSTFGKLYVMPILQNDVLQSFEGKQSVFDFKGSLGIRTYESNTRFFSTLQIVLFVLALLISLLIFTGNRIMPLILRIRIRPEYAYAGIGMVFGMMMLVITPPFQVPDEPVHFYRSYQVAEFNLFKLKDNVPASLLRLADSCNRMQFSTHEKTSRREIMALAGIPAGADRRVHTESPNYTIPYIPQAAGIIAGKIFNASPLWLLYLGRFFNLVVSLLLVFLAIRTTPVFKWVFLMLGILPMSLFQFASLSYDAATIGLSFLLLAWILKLAFDGSDFVTTRRLLWLFTIALLLAASKPPYFLILLTFLIIPVAKLGSLKRYILVFAGLLVSSLLVSQLWGPARKMVERLTEVPSPSEIHTAGFLPDDLFTVHPLMSKNPLAMALPMLPHAPQGESAAAVPESKGAVQDTTAGKETTPDTVQAKAAVTANPFDPAGQKEFILQHPFDFAGILFDTVIKSGNLYIVSIIGLFGWIDTQVPDALAYLYLLILIMLALLSPAPGIHFGWMKKMVLFATFLISFVLIEAALYIYCNPVGCSPITAVQGRYFIAVSPLLFLLFFNNRFPGFLTRLFRRNPVNLNQGKGNHRKTKEQLSSSEYPLSRVFPLLAVVFGIFTLCWSVYLILDRFYVVTF